MQSCHAFFSLRGKKQRGLLLVLLLCCVSAPKTWAADTAAVCTPPVKAVRPVPPAQADEFTIATQNLQRFFDDEPGGRGDVVSAEKYRQKREQLAAQVVDVLRSPDVLAVQEAENLKVLQDLAMTIRARKGPDYKAVLLEGNDYGGIDVGFLLRRDIEVLKVEALLKTRKLDRHALFDRPPLRLRLRMASGSELDIINVHLKSLRGSDDDKQAEKIARKRQRQAEVLAEWLSAELAMRPQTALVLLGDLNATPDAAGGVDVLGMVQASGLTDVDERLPAGERYSYIHDCRGEALDHVLASKTIVPAVQRVAVSRGNAGVARRATVHEALRSADHDGLVLYLRKE